MSEVRETNGQAAHKGITRMGLVVILALVAVILAMVLPPIRPRERGVSWVAVEMSGLRIALQAYEAEYDKLPELSKSATGERDNAALMAILVARTNDSIAASYNSRRIAFFEVSDRLSAKGEFLDPWQHPYHFAWDNKPVDSNSSSSKPRPNDSIRIWSDGPNGRNENGAGDDPHSWE